MTTRTVIIAAACVAIISAFLPWVSFLGLSRNGLDYGDGWVTLIVGAIGLVLTWRSSLGWVPQAAAGSLVTMIAIYDLNHAGDLAAIGMYLTLLAGIVWAVAAVVDGGNRARRRDAGR